MSEHRIALVAEGPTDYVLIDAALRAVLPVAFTLTLLQPERTLPDATNGWAGVLKWCHAAGRRHAGPLNADPTLGLFDMLIVHLDADVALKTYADCGQDVEGLALDFHWPPLPCNQACPPASATCSELQTVLTGWLGLATPGPRTVWCLPSQSTGTWLAAALLGPDHTLCQNAECNPSVEARLAQLPKKQRVSKSVREYRLHANAIVQNWDQVKAICPQALAFEQAVLAV
ncbi:MAG: hypothetical protein RLZZ618_1936 [Pseudomonadota bacterium]|jgi:hypothetical protein